MEEESLYSSEKDYGLTDVQHTAFALAFEANITGVRGASPLDEVSESLGVATSNLLG